MWPSLITERLTPTQENGWRAPGGTLRAHHTLSLFSPSRLLLAPSPEPIVLQAAVSSPQTSPTGERVPGRWAGGLQPPDFARST